MDPSEHPPLCICPPSALKVQGMRGNDGAPLVMLELSNAVFRMPFALTVDQAHEHLDGVRRAILEAEELVIPTPRLLSATGQELAK